MGATVQVIVRCDYSHCDKTYILDVPIEKLSASGIAEIISEKNDWMPRAIAVGDKIYCDDFCADPENEY